MYQFIWCIVSFHSRMLYGFAETENFDPSWFWLMLLTDSKYIYIRSICQHDQVIQRVFGPGQEKNRVFLVWLVCQIYNSSLLQLDWGMYKMKAVGVLSNSKCGKKYWGVYWTNCGWLSPGVGLLSTDKGGDFRVGGLVLRLRLAAGHSNSLTKTMLTSSSSSFTVGVMVLSQPAFVPWQSQTITSIINL